MRYTLNPSPNHKLHAVKMIKETLNCGLEQAKEAVDNRELYADLTKEQEDLLISNLSKAYCQVYKEKDIEKIENTKENLSKRITNVETRLTMDERCLHIIHFHPASILFLPIIEQYGSIIRTILHKAIPYVTFDNVRSVEENGVLTIILSVDKKHNKIEDIKNFEKFTECITDTVADMLSSIMRLNNIKLDMTPYEQ